MYELTKEQAFNNLWRGVIEIATERLLQAKEMTDEIRARDTLDRDELDIWSDDIRRYGNIISRLATAVILQDFDEVISLYLHMSETNERVSDMLLQMIWFQTEGVKYVQF